MFNPTHKTHFSLSFEDLGGNLQILALKDHAGISQPFRFDMERVSEDTTPDLQGLPHKQALLALPPSGIHGQIRRTPQVAAPIPVTAKLKSHRLKEGDVYISTAQGRALHAPVIAWYRLDRDYRAQRQLGHCSRHSQAPTAENLVLDPMQVTTLGAGPRRNTTIASRTPPRTAME